MSAKHGLSMRQASWRFWGVLGAMAVAPAAFGQNSAQECRNNVANALNLNNNSISTSNGGNGENGNPVVQWNANLAGRNIQGFCETNRNGRVISTQLGAFYGGGFGRGDGRGDGRGNGNGRGNQNIEVGRFNLDTSGRGTLNALGRTVRVTRGWLDTRNIATIAMSGEDNFKITFTGNVVQVNSDREFTLRITASDRGDATGTAIVRLNSSRDEVEFIQVDGRVGNRPVNGTFNRN